MLAQKETVGIIAALEWDMMVAVNEGAERASCQEDEDTFVWMRTAQFSAWSEDAAQSYLIDLMEAKGNGGNLVRDKYIYMMKNVSPTEYEGLLPLTAGISEAVRETADTVNMKLMCETALLFEKYPRITANNRPLWSRSDDLYTTSIETYQYCELLTYSEKTLKLLNFHIDSFAGKDTGLAERILINTVGYYGYNSLEAAEKAAR